MPPAQVPAGRPSGARRWGNLIITLVIALVAVLAVVWVVRRANAVTLEIDGKPIANAGAVVTDADAAFRQLTTDDGAHPPEGAGCWFAPSATTSSGAAGNPRPRIACGPVRLGVSTGDKVWVLGTVSYSPSSVSQNEMTAKFGGLRGIEALDAGDLVRPDGAGPPAAENLPAPDPVLRDQEGRRLLGERALLDTVERSLLPAAERSRAAIAGDAACWFGTRPDGEGRRLSDGSLWCGPVLLQTSSTDEPWARVALSVQQGEVFALARVRATAPTTVSSTQKLPAGTILFRPDGRPAPERIDLALPDAKAQAAGFVDVLTEVPADLALAPPAGDGRLNIPGRRIELDGLARVPKVGSGRTAVVAAAGEELVVARFRRTDPVGGTGAKGSAQIVAGARRTPFTDWSRLPETGLLVVSAPRGTDAALEVLYEGETQSLSLTTGRRASDARPALYRRADEAGVGRPVEVTAALPTGPPARAAGVVSAVRIDAWRERLGWAPAGRAFVTVTLEGFTVTKPCCALTRLDAVPRWSLALPDGTVVDARPVVPATPGTVVFEAPDAVTAAELRLALDVTWAQGAVAAGPVAVPLVLPS